MNPPIPAADIRKALAGEDPPGEKRSLATIGEAMGAHRNGNNAGVGYSKQAVALYIKDPDKQGQDFIEAFLSWRVAERTRQPLLRVRYQNLNGLIEDAAHLVQAGSGEPDTLLLIANLPANTVLVPGAGVIGIALCAADIAPCKRCGQRFVRRSWNHSFCTEECATLTRNERYNRKEKRNG